MFLWRAITNASLLFLSKASGLSPDLIFQQDETPAHFSFLVHCYLNQKLGSRSILRGGLVVRTPRSTDLTLCDFFFWGYTKDQLFTNLRCTIAELKTKPWAAIASITEENFPNLKRNTEFRLRLLLPKNGAHFEKNSSNCVKIGFLDLKWAIYIFNWFEVMDLFECHFFGTHCKSRRSWMASNGNYCSVLSFSAFLYTYWNMHLLIVSYNEMLIGAILFT